MNSCFVTSPVSCSWETAGYLPGDVGFLFVGVVRFRDPTSLCVLLPSRDPYAGQDQLANSQGLLHDLGYQHTGDQKLNFFLEII